MHLVASHTCPYFGSYAVLRDYFAINCAKMGCANDSRTSRVHFGMVLGVQYNQMLYFLMHLVASNNCPYFKSYEANRD